MTWPCGKRYFALSSGTTSNKKYIPVADDMLDSWPNLQVYTTGGVAFETYRKSLEKLFARPLNYIDTYLASKGYLAT